MLQKDGNRDPRGQIKTQLETLVLLPAMVRI